MQKRCSLILFLAAAVMFFALPVWAQPPGNRELLIEGYARTIKDMRSRGTLPIIDVEHHWGGKLPLDDLIAKMDAHGVALTWLGQKEEKGGNHALHLAAIHPTRLVPTTIHGDGPRWHGHDRSLIEELERDVRSGRFFAMGEFEGRHYVSSTNDRDVHMPVDSPEFEAVFRLSQGSSMPFLIHHEAEDRLLPEIERMLARYPGAKAVWCHAGRNRDPGSWTVLPKADGVRSFLRKYPNLYFDLNQARPGGKHRGTGHVDSVLFDVRTTFGDKGRKDWSGAELKTEWKKLLEEYPDRFVIGTDINTGRWDRYGDVVEGFRKVVLGALSKNTSERIAWKNAWKLMTGMEWKDR